MKLASSKSLLLTLLLLLLVSSSSVASLTTIAVSETKFHVLQGMSKKQRTKTKSRGRLRGKAGFQKFQYLLTPHTTQWGTRILKGSHMTQQ